MLGNIERRLALVILLTAILPLASAMFLAYSLLNYASSVWLRPEVEQELERGIEHLQGLRARRQRRHEAANGQAMAGDPCCAPRHAATTRTRVRGLSMRSFRATRNWCRSRWKTAPGRPLAIHDRGRPLDDGTSGSSTSGARSPRTTRHRRSSRRLPSLVVTRWSSNAPDRRMTRIRSSRRNAPTSTRGISTLSRFCSALRWWLPWR